MPAQTGFQDCFWKAQQAQQHCQLNAGGGRSALA